MMASTARVGFHAAYVVEGGKKEETGAGNALVGAYLSHLGLSYEAIVYITEKPPDDVTWLTRDDARRFGIDVAILDLRALPSARTLPPHEAPFKRQPVPRENRLAQREINLDAVARDFAAAYFAHWSDNNEGALTYFGGVYASKITFYDRKIDRRALMDAKRKFAELWPERVYTTRPESIKTQCVRNSSTCTITGQVEWECRNAKREARTAGLASFTLQISVSYSKIRIEGEWSTVLSTQQ